MHDDDDDLTTIENLLPEDWEYDLEPTWGQRLKEWAIIGAAAVALSVVCGLAGVGALTLWFVWALS